MIFGTFKKFLKFISNRITLTVIALFIQFMFYFLIYWYLTSRYLLAHVIMWIVAVVTVLWLTNSRINPGYKLIWTSLILALPLVGIVMYFSAGKSRVAKLFQKEMKKIETEMGDVLEEDPEVRKHMDQEDLGISNQSRYPERMEKAPAYEHTVTEYFSVGEDWFAKYVEELKKAKHYIFLEFFIISPGYMWNTVLEILKEKVKEGVDVRIIYDGMICVTTLPPKYYKVLQSYGIKCAAFNPFRPVLNIIQNNRDHRKITVIDGHTAFTGGINLSDEYINQWERFGHWKDSGIYLHGEAVWSFTVMFLKMWSVITGLPCDISSLYHPNQYYLETFPSDGFVQPYGDSPLDDETVGENVYRNIISNAKKYVYIFTPYLVLDNEIMTELCTASRKGVDVRIVTPGIPDKKMVFLLSQSYYEQLLEAGVRIYQYTPGFIHSKSFVSDDEVAVVGSINLDYRSLYLHFECGCWMYKTASVMQVKQDALNTFEISQEIDLDFCRNRNIAVRGFQAILRLIAPTL